MLCFFNVFTGSPLQERSCQTAIMIMEAFARLERPEKYVWDLMGHAGDGPEIELVVESGTELHSVADRWKVVDKMKT